MILNGANRYVFATNIEDIEEIRPCTVSRELFDANAKLWAEWRESQSREEAEYPNLCPVVVPSRRAALGRKRSLANGGFRPADRSR